MKSRIWILFILLGLGAGIGLRLMTSAPEVAPEPGVTAAKASRSPLSEASPTAAPFAGEEPPGLEMAAWEEAKEDPVKRLRFLTQLNGAELLALLRAENGPLSDAEEQTILRALTEVEPAAAFRWFRKDRDFLGQMRNMPIVFRIWAKTDPAAALSAARQLSGMVKESAINQVFRQVAQDDPARALALLDSLEPSDENSHRLNTIFREWTRQDAGAAEQALRALPPGPERDTAWAAYAGGLASLGPERAIAVIEGIPEVELRAKATTQLLSEWFKTDFDAALEFAGNLSPSAEREAILREALRDAANLDGVKTIEWTLTHVSGRLQQTVLRDAIFALSREDPAAAAKALASLPYGEAYRENIHNVAYFWSEHDPQAAMEWARTLPPGNERAAVLSVTQWSFVRNQPEEALAHAQSIEDPKERASMFAMIAEEKANSDPIAALNWTHQIEPEMRSKAREEVLSRWAYQDPEGLLAYINSNPSEKLTSGDYGTIAWRLASTDTDSAARWALSLNSTENQKSAVRALSNSWLRTDTGAATEWISTLPAGEVRDAAAANVVQRVVASDPGEAFTWAVSVTDERDRGILLEQVVRQWNDRAPAEVRQAIGASALSEGEKTKLLSEIGG